MKTSESIANIAAGLAKFHEQVQQPKKEAENPFFKSKYVTLEGVIAAIKTGSKDTGLSYIQIPQSSDKSVGVKTVITHSKGEFLEFDTFTLPVEKNTAQSAGSALTYARRYSLSAAFGISSDVDDDGNAASGNSSDKKPYAKQKQSKPAPITKVQINEIKDKAHRLAEKNASEVGIVYEGLNITDVSSLTKVYADECIATLNTWLGGE
ncbi:MULTISPECIES: ERF family protein [Bacilli]|uniref:ERF family protein n=1 Tax=Bacilli TaxID=91061 RepID=UPI00083FD99C|nr:MULTISPECIES: ERF family protein [Bacilli]ODJ72009.1 hypothetical protein BFR39_04530 [Brochothrix thermosphacta]